MPWDRGTLYILFCESLNAAESFITYAYLFKQFDQQLHFILQTSFQMKVLYIGFSFCWVQLPKLASKWSPLSNRFLFQIHASFLKFLSCWRRIKWTEEAHYDE